MSRRRLVAALLCAVLNLPLAASAQGGPGVAEPFHIFAVLWRGETEVEAGFRDYLTQRGVPFRMTVRDLNLNAGNAPRVVEEIRAARPDLVYTAGTGTTNNIFGSIDAEEPGSFVGGVPGVFTLVSYPKEARIVESFENPGRAVTGVSFLAPVEAQLNTILAYRPFARMAVVYDRTARNSRVNVAELREIAPRLGLELIERPVPLGWDGRPDPRTLSDLVRQVKEEGADILYIGPDSFMVRYGKVYTSAALAAGLPTFAAIQPLLKNSRAMFGLVTDYYTLGKLTALQAERILVEKQRPEEMPMARLGRYKLWINMDVARELGMYPPMDMIAVADFRTSPRD